ncbi:MAG TPA: hypothetical protein VHE34_28090 [Puia sp.]|uniref:hypothetical protein n=1 Tax=Puia sp. TaxID=2045100 RepID=UPI002D1E2B51|nr:hypothetical protein [Puia sp.]HVU99128.1 hypothetical protein [Puia sp.]
MTKAEIISQLTSNKSSDRRRAAKEIGKQKLIDVAEQLFDAFIEEIKDLRTWETQYHMILSLGLIDYKLASKYIDPIVYKNKSHDMITYAAAQTHVRLKRISPSDAKPIIELLRFGGLSLVDGALTPLAYDKMQPCDDEILELITLSWNLHQHRDRLGNEQAYCDPRYGLVAACAGWNIELTSKFLRHCIDTSETDKAIRSIAENSLRSKYSKLR